MGFKCGLVGLPNAGKSTIFNALTNLGVEASAYPFCTISPHVGIVPLQDPRLIKIQKMYESSKAYPTILEFVDIAGLVQGASKGEGLGNQFLSHIGQVNAIAHVVRCFQDENVSHPYQTLDPARDVEIVTLELILKDLEIVDNALQKAKNASKSGDPKSRKAAEDLELILATLSGQKELRLSDWSDSQQEIIRHMNLLTAKPVIFVANLGEPSSDSDALLRNLEISAGHSNSPVVPFRGKLLSEIAALEEQDRTEFVKIMGLEDSGLNPLVKAGYSTLNLITFFTANEKEAHAWTVERDTPVQMAVSQVHSDFAALFIKAEVIHFEDLVQYDSIKLLHEKGKASVHGKEYPVQDGDLILVRIRH